MHSNSLKRVFIRQINAGARPVEMYLRPDVLSLDRNWDVLTSDGQAIELDHKSVQAVYFVSSTEETAAWARDDATGGSGSQLPGTWVRLRCLDHSSIEGILASNWLDIDRGVWLTPLHAESAWQRVFIPRPAIDSVHVQEVVRPVRRRKSKSAPPRQSVQIDLFGEPTLNGAGPRAKVIS